MNGKDWNIIPNVSINEIAFKTDRSEVRKILGKPERTFKKTNDSINVTDAYSDFHIYYSAEDKLEAIEFYGNEVCIRIDSKILFPGNINDARKILTDLEDCYGSFISKSSSIGISAEEENITSVLVGCKNYYK